MSELSKTLRADSDNERGREARQGLHPGISFETTRAVLLRNYTRWRKGGRFRASGVLFYPLTFVAD